MNSTRFRVNNTVTASKTRIMEEKVQGRVCYCYKITPIIAKKVAKKAGEDLGGSEAGAALVSVTLFF